MSRLDHLWAEWRGQYVADDTKRVTHDGGCVLCSVVALGLEDPSQVVHVGSEALVIVNAYPYTSGHVMVLPRAHVEGLDELASSARAELFELLHFAVRALEHAYAPHGVNFGANVGRGSGAGIPEHLHIHALPRWEGDTNFMTTIANARVMPESLETTTARLREAFAAVGGLG